MGFRRNVVYGPALGFARMSLPGCERATRLESGEKALATGGADLSVFHRVAEGDQGLGLRFPGFLIGIEKSPQGRIGYADRVLGVTAKHAADPRDRHRIESFLGDPKKMFVSHLVEYSYVADHGLPRITEDIFFNAYDQPAQAQHAYTAGYTAFTATFRQRLAARLAERRYSHILVYCMGWNTDQQESLRNYNSLLLRLMDRYAAQPDGGAGFRPLVIGVSWPSEWRWPLFAAIGQVLSYPVKSNDADEIGVTWVNLLINEVLAGLKTAPGGNIPLIVVGHSFGARVVTRAIASAALIERQSETPVVDLMIAVQGAFSTNRFISGGGIEGAPYRDFPHLARKYVLTWSESDSANPIAAYVTGARHAGGAPGYRQSRREKARGLFEYFRAEAEGNGLRFTAEADRSWQDSLRDSNVITYVDVSPFVRYHAYGKGGKAHSDIYTWEMAELIHSAIAGVVPAARIPGALL